MTFISQSSLLEYLSFTPPLSRIQLPSTLHGPDCTIQKAFDDDDDDDDDVTVELDVEVVEVLEDVTILVLVFSFAI